VKLTDEQKAQLDALKQNAYFEEMKRMAEEDARRQAHQPHGVSGAAGFLMGGLNVLGQMGRNMQENEARMIEANKKKGKDPFSLW
jgi:hypothetical protein